MDEPLDSRDPLLSNEHSVATARRDERQQQKKRAVSSASASSHPATKDEEEREGHQHNPIRRALQNLMPKPVKRGPRTTSTTTSPLAPLSESTPLVNGHHHHVNGSSPKPPARDDAVRAERNAHGSSSSAPPPTIDDDEENPQDLARRQRARRGWRRIVKEVRSGDMLLRAAAVDPTGRHLSTDERDRERQKAQEWIRRGVEFTLPQCLLAVSCYVVVAIAAFSFVLDDWTCTDSVYFAMVTFTTIGYGDLVPDSYLSRVFTCFFALSGVACLGIALGVIGNNVMEAQEKAVQRTSRVAQHRVLGFFSDRRPPKPTTVTVSRRHLLDEINYRMSSAANLVVARTSSQSAINVGGDDDDDDGNSATTTTDNTITTTTAKENPGYQLLFHFCLVLALLLIFALCVASDPGVDVGRIDFLDALYFTVITATTVGYGDLSPQTQHGRLVAIIFIPLTVGAMGHFLSSVASVIMDSRRSSFQKQMDQRELTMNDLEVMDADGDGQVTRAEYLEFILLAMGKVDKDFIEELRATFRRLDADGTGSLDKEDLVTAARMKLQTSSKKLELSTYKRQLLRQAEDARQAAAATSLRERFRRHDRGASFWDRNLSLVSRVFARDDGEGTEQNTTNNNNDVHSFRHSIF